VAEENSGHGFLTGLIIGGVIGAALTIWFVERTRKPGRRGGLASFIKEEVLGGAREAIRRAIEEGKEAAQRTRTDLEGKLREESEE